MRTFLSAILTYVSAFVIPRHHLALEAVALRQQLAVYKRKQPHPKLRRSDRLFWVVVRRIWNNWSEGLILVKPDTNSLLASGRIPPVLAMALTPAPSGAAEGSGGNPTLNSPNEKGKPKLGRTSHPWRTATARFRHLRTDCIALSATAEAQSGRKQSEPWLVFLKNHREALAAFDLFTVPNLYFRTLYCFFVIEHARRRILHFNVTFHQPMQASEGFGRDMALRFTRKYSTPKLCPQVLSHATPTSDWVVQQLREAFPLPCPYQYVLFDHDSKFGSQVLQFLKSSALEPVRTSVRSPWQNGVAERWVGSVRRELLDHIIPLNEYHLRRLGRDYLAYYHQDRTHIGLNKNTPTERAVERRSPLQSRIVSTSRIGGFHHRYRWSEAA